MKTQCVVLSAVSCKWCINQPVHCSGNATETHKKKKAYISHIKPYSVDIPVYYEWYNKKKVAYWECDHLKKENLKLTEICLQ